PSPATNVAPRATATVRPGNLQGTWTAEPTADTKVTLTFPDDNRFTWKVEHKNGTQQFEGQRTFGNGMLTLAPEGENAQPPMVGRVEWQDENHFIFKAFGAAPGDQGLTFRRSS